MDTEFKQQLIELFTDADVPHGVPFNNRRRWCSVCCHPRISCTPGAAETWKGKTCIECSSVWPEYVMEFVHEMQTNDDFMDNFPEPMVN